jgi:ABC-type uncharacterized transport system substrate-binding protein
MRLPVGAGDCTCRVARHIAPMSRASFLVCLALAAALPLAARAHPHIFVDAGFAVTRDGDGRPVSVEVTWLYDELYTLILLQDYGLDPDFDLLLTEEEVAATLGFDLNWSAGFEGGLVIRQGGRRLELGPPEPVSLELVEPGQFRTTHRRAITGAAPGDFAVQIYDPAFYIAFEMILPSQVRDAPACQTTLVRADLDAAYAALEAAIEDIGGAVSAEDNFPPVGAHFADRIEVTCPAS